MGYGAKILVTGDYACFTRPEMKVERVSYDIPTPSALEGLLKSIYWKPAIRWVIDEIVVFNPIRFENIRRNEVKDKLLLSNVKAQMKNPDKNIFINAQKSRSQRTSMVLTNVKYGVTFHFEMTGFNSGYEDTEKKHYNIILRRLRNGQHYRTPCLGCSEFPVKSIELVDDFSGITVSDELKGERDLGYMLYSLDFFGDEIDKENWENSKFSDMAQAFYYRPKMIDGVVNVAKYAREGNVC